MTLVLASPVAGQGSEPTPTSEPSPETAGDRAAPATMQRENPDEAPPAASEGSPTEAILGTLAPGLRGLAADVLEHNPDLARLRRQVLAAEARAPQAGSLADPMAALTVFALPPETRVGPQRVRASISQKFPWFGKLDLKERAAVLEAAEARADLEARRLAILTDLRRQTHELAFLEEYLEIARQEREHLLTHEEAARARYSAGSGLQQGVVKIQAAVTRTEGEILSIESRRETVRAAINRLRDRPAGTPVEPGELPEPVEAELSSDELAEIGRSRRPEMAAAGAEIARREVLVELAEKQFRPDLTLGLGYTVVDGREDPAGRANPPPDDGDDVLAVTGAINLPVWRQRLEAGLTEALERESAARDRRRSVAAAIAAESGEHASRLPLLYDEWDLYRDVLLVQAEEALRSTEAAYTTGKLNALDILDAEHVLFQVRIAAARTRTDWAVTRARLEGAVAASLGDGDLSSPRPGPNDSPDGADRSDRTSPEGIDEGTDDTSTDPSNHTTTIRDIRTGESPVTTEGDPS